MAHAVTSPPMLRLKRSVQSGDQLMAGTYSIVYEEDSTMAFFFAGGRLDLSEMAAGDVVDVQLWARLAEDSALTLVDTITYTGARPAGRDIAMIGFLSNVYGVAVQMRQTAGTFRTVQCEFYDAKRIGLV